MHRLTTLILLFASLLPLVAQVRIDGKVLDAETGKPLRSASVTIKNSNGKIQKFTTTKVDGAFSLQIDNIAGCNLDVSILNYAKQSLPLDSISLPITIEMQPSTTMLKEVTVKADKIREQGDTITYRVGAFAQKQDRSIGDVLARMPGMKVESSGKIQYQGEDINKFYIEGSDLLGGKYGIATNGISHDDVGAVEVMENHQPMQVLSGISYSDKAAINLKLKNKAKATWTYHGSAAAGYLSSPQTLLWEGELFAMAVLPSFQNITTIKTNNTGNNLSAQVADFLASMRGTNLSSISNLSLPASVGLNSRRTTFNQSALASINSLWKLGRGEVKTQFDYTFNHLTAEASNISTYFLPTGNKVITESRNGYDRMHSLSGKAIYELNLKTAFVNNTLQTNLDWDNIGLNTQGTINNTQNAVLPNYYAANKLKVIKRFHGKHLITFNSSNEWESLPQSLTANLNSKSIRQQTHDQAFFTDESAAYTLAAGDLAISLEGGLKGFLRKFNSDISDLPQDIEGLTTNAVNTNYLTLYAQPKFEYNLRRVNFTLSTPISAAYYTFDKSIADRTEFYFSPSLAMNWKPNNRFNIRVRGNMGRAPMSLNMILPGMVMTDYRSFRSGVDDFYNSESKGVSTSLTYKHTTHGIFANALAIRSWNQTPYTLVQKLYGDYLVYSYSTAKNNGDRFIAQGNIGKTLDFIRGSANLNGLFTRIGTHLISQDREVNNITTSWSGGVKLNGMPASFLSFDYSFGYSANCLSMNGLEATWLRNIRNELMFNIIPHSKWEWHISGEHYLNEIASNRFKPTLLCDTKLIFKPTKRMELSASLTNIFNNTEYNYITYNQLSSYESQRYLRGRELLISIILKK